jgi:hypothetical protein
MFNAEIPSRAELPSTAQLVKSTIIALVAAAVILITIVLPSEYAVDPTGIGRALKLTQMGDIKKQLSIEAEADRQRDRQQAPDRRSSLGQIVAALLVSPAMAHPDHDKDEVAPGIKATDAIAQPAPGGKTDETVVTLKPNEGVEYKLTMVRGGGVQYSWRTDGGGVNYDLHGSPKGGGKETSYKKGRDVASDSGILTAAYDGSHGWFWRNRGSKDVTITLKTTGAYNEIKRMN